MRLARRRCGRSPCGWVSPNPGLLAPAQCLLLGVILARQYLDMKNYSIAMLYAHR